MRAIYAAGSGLYHAAIRLSARWNSKAAAWVHGRQGLWERLQAKAPQLHGCLWMHCASTGEFEQGRPVLEAIRQARPELPVLLTFFSPSGHAANLHCPLATHVEYLPPDSPDQARRLLELVRPRAAVFVKYEFWYHHLTALQRAAVPTFLVSAVFRKGQPFFRWYGSAWRRMLRCFTGITVQDKASLHLLARLGPLPVQLAGDTRFDRVAAIAAAREEVPLARAFAGSGPVLVCGSTWPGDERLLTEALQAMGPAAPKCIVAPHELLDEQLAAIERTFPKPLARWSELEQTPPDNVAATLGKERHGSLLIDRMGLLSRLYRHGQVAYVGGGFEDGIHNLLEPAAWGLPVIFGPRHRKFPEAQALIDAGAGREVRNAEELLMALEGWFGDPEALRIASEAAARYVGERTGGAGRVAAAVLAAI
jgi:3-deoxy-D-manno-octulosonic-acid transferase